MTTTQTEPASLSEVFLNRVRSTPSGEAFRYRVGSGWKSLSWQDTADQAYQIAAGLIDLGVQTEQRVAIAAGTRIEWILADLGVLCAGAATTTVYPSTTAEDIGYIITDSGSAVVIVENADQVTKFLQAGLTDLTAIVVFDEAGVDRNGPMPLLTLDELSARGRDLLDREPDVVLDRIKSVGPESLATLVYTSGTTGRPKGVRLVHANWVYEGNAVSKLGILQPDDVQYLWLPLSHVLGKMLIAMQMELGFCTAVDGDLTRIVENLKDVRPTFMGGAPRIFEKVRGKVMLTAKGGGGLKAKIFSWAFGIGITASRLRNERKPIPSMVGLQLKVADKLVFSKIRELVGGRIRFFVSGSAKLSTEVAEWFDAAGLTILEGYGLTETSAAISVNLPGDTRFGTVGPALPGSEFMIAADGEILARGGSIMRGYHHNDEATHEVLTADGWLHTGDIGELHDGFLSVTDRKKDLIKTSGGKYVAPQKIETLFKSITPYASQIVVHGEGRKFVSALITLDEEIDTWAAANGKAGADHAALAEDPQVVKLMGDAVDELNAQLARWETIKKFTILPVDLSVDEGELTPSMKVRRKVVEKKYMSVLDQHYTD